MRRRLGSSAERNLDMWQRLAYGDWRDWPSGSVRGNVQL
jgi:hypothetical protein